MEGFLHFFESLGMGLKAGGIFLLFNGLTALNSIILIFLRLCGKAGKRSFFALVGFSAFCLFFSCALLFASPKITATEITVCIFATLAVYALISVPVIVVFICEKGANTSDNEQAYQFVRKIDDQIKAQESVETPPIYTSTQILRCVEEKEKERRSQIDFSHVRSIIDRLNEYELSSNDRHAVRELEIALFDAEKRGEGVEIKARLNDGLNSLLKIMAKYGV